MKRLPLPQDGTITVDLYSAAASSSMASPRLVPRAGPSVHTEPAAVLETAIATAVVPLITGELLPSQQSAVSHAPALPALTEGVGEEADEPGEMLEMMEKMAISAGPEVGIAHFAALSYAPLEDCAVAVRPRVAGGDSHPFGPIGPPGPAQNLDLVERCFWTAAEEGDEGVFGFQDAPSEAHSDDGDDDVHPDDVVGEESSAYDAARRAELLVAKRRAMAQLEELKVEQDRRNYENALMDTRAWAAAQTQVALYLAAVPCDAEDAPLLASIESTRSGMTLSLEELTGFDEAALFEYWKVECFGGGPVVLRQLDEARMAGRNTRLIPDQIGFVSRAVTAELISATMEDGDQELGNRYLRI